MAANQPQEPKNPGEGIRSMRSTGVFRLINFELYTKPVRIIAEYSNIYYVHICLRVYFYAFYFVEQNYNGNRSGGNYWSLWLYSVHAAQVRGSRLLRCRAGRWKRAVC